MKVKVLVDNNSYINHYLCGEPGASFYIEVDNKKILLDTGYSGVVVDNAEKMNIDLSKIDKIVISHGHNDHTGGLVKLVENYNTKNIDLISHPDAFYLKKSKGENVGSFLNKEYILEKFNYITSKKPYNITENCIYLGEIPEFFDFEKRRVLGERKINGKLEKDYLLDDSALVYKSKNGIFIVTGCSHSGICNIVEYSKKVTGDSRVIGVIGGFHLFDVDERLEKTIEYFKNSKINMVYPSHCTSLKVKAEILKEFDFTEVGVGFEIDIN